MALDTLYGGESQLLSSCTAAVIKRVLRDMDVEPQTILKAKTKDALLQLCEAHGVGPWMPDEWTIQNIKRAKSANTKTLDQKLNAAAPRSSFDNAPHHKGKAAILPVSAWRTREEERKKSERRGRRQPKSATRAAPAPNPPSQAPATAEPKPHAPEENPLLAKLRSRRGVVERGEGDESAAAADANDRSGGQPRQTMAAEVAASAAKQTEQTVHAEPRQPLGRGRRPPPNRADAQDVEDTEDDYAVDVLLAAASRNVSPDGSTTQHLRRQQQQHKQQPPPRPPPQEQEQAEDDEEEAPPDGVHQAAPSPAAVVAKVVAAKGFARAGQQRQYLAMAAASPSEGRHGDPQGTGAGASGPGADGVRVELDADDDIADVGADREEIAEALREVVPDGPTLGDLRAALASGRSRPLVTPRGGRGRSGGGKASACASAVLSSAFA